MTFTTPHALNYDAKAQALGIGALKHLVSRVASKEDIERAIDAGDEPLNTIQLAKWDAQHQSVCRLYSQAKAAGFAEPGGWSLCNTVCVLKHVARYYVAERAL